MPQSYTFMAHVHFTSLLLLLLQPQLLSLSFWLSFSLLLAPFTFICAPNVSSLSTVVTNSCCRFLFLGQKKSFFYFLILVFWPIYIPAHPSCPSGFHFFSLFNLNAKWVFASSLSSRGKPGWLVPFIFCSNPFFYSFFSAYRIFFSFLMILRIRFHFLPLLWCLILLQLEGCWRLWQKWAFFFLFPFPVPLAVVSNIQISVF